MTTPSEGPGGWEQGNWAQSGDWLRNLSTEQQQNLQAFVGMTPAQREAAVAFASLDDRQQGNLMRFANTDPMRTRVENRIRGAVARAHLMVDNTKQRISETAQSLASQSRQYANAALDGANRGYEATVNAVARGTAATGNAIAQGARATGNAVAQGARVTGNAVAQGARATGAAVAQTGRNVRDTATELGQQAAGAYNRGVEQATEMAQRGQVWADQTWQAGADRLNAAGQRVAEGARATGAAVVGGVQGAVAAGRDAMNKTGRWFEGKFNSTMLKAESTLVSFNAGRHEPPLGQDMAQVLDDKGKLEMIQRLSASMDVVTPETNAAIQGLAQESQARLETQEAVRVAGGGVAPATQAVSQVPAQPAEQGQQGQQTAANLTKNTNDKGGMNR